ncbi:choline/glycine/proline betaine transport protein [Desulfosalsimonas propionicica]|uniref:Choline/glycine/proline betaine transport protein n=1 Tax=Desulfosalsimonas propionicica TaxID=332175 RepID=A0A7W0HM14_9BACT|nr:BCCT family transporter [Desulfosalsimonas propionicica]MBA2882904.1 choline/glycine/proline betaine transport protein [Desulfosalsimonas propionicica]
MAEPDNTPDPTSGIHRFFDIHPPVFWPTVILLVVFISITLGVGKPMERIFSAIQTNVSDYFGWFLILSVNCYLLIMLYIALGKYGSIRLGGKNAVPEFSRTAWFAMLFSAGMGIGILFWSVAEPIYHFTNPDFGGADSMEAAGNAMQVTFLHWGLHPWGIYALVGMSLAFFSFNRNKPLAIRSVFYPLLGERVYGPMGDAIDVLAVLSTMFGLATSLGFGVQQINAGLHYLFGLPDTIYIQMILVGVITSAAAMSVASGLDQGVKRLSELNMNLGAVLLVFVLIVGPTLFILDTYVENIGVYLNDFFKISFWAEGYRQSDWQNSWTIFYWSWWISWSPFVGMFIARISRGRTLREFVLSVLIVPSLLTFLWLTTFGGSALFLELGEAGNMAAAVKENIAISIYELLGNFPFAIAANFAAILLVVSFFVTSSDSGSLVVDTFTSGGKLTSPVTQRIFWAFLQGAVAAVLLFGGGLDALQTASITTGLPFAVVLLLMGWSLTKGLEKEYQAERIRARDMERESYQQLIQDLVDKKAAGRAGSGNQNPENQNREGQ